VIKPLICYAALLTATAHSKDSGFRDSPKRMLLNDFAVLLILCTYYNYYITPHLRLFVISSKSVTIISVNLLLRKFRELLESEKCNGCKIKKEGGKFKEEKGI
jgi:hypothetical protein